MPFIPSPHTHPPRPSLLRLAHEEQGESRANRTESRWRPSMRAFTRPSDPLRRR